MPITYTLDVRQMQVAPQMEDQTDVVVTVSWAYVGTDGANNAYFGGTTAVTYTAGAPFTPYAQLTEDQVAGWVLAAWSEEQTQTQQATLAAQLALLSPPLPWSAPPATPNDAPAV